MFRTDCVYCVTHPDAGLVGNGDGVGSSDEEMRTKSAPSKRKSWSHKRVELKTAEGRPIHVEAPGEYQVKMTDMHKCSVG